MADFRISWSGKNVDIPKLPAKHAFELSVMQALTSEPQVYRDGSVLRELEPRVDLRFSARFPNLSPLHTGSEDATRLLRMRLENAWLYLSRNQGTVSVAWDSAMTVNTTTNQDRDSGDSTVRVSSNTGIVNGQYYRLIGARSEGEANRHQLVHVASRSGTTLTLTDDLDYDFASGAHFIDELYFPSAVLREQSPAWPFNDHGERETWFDFDFSFFMGPLS